MNPQAISFCHFMDRMHSIHCAHLGSQMATDSEINTRKFRAFHEKGTMVHVVINKDGLNYVRFVPLPSVQWLFDAYA